jgi:transposase-like protein
VEQIYREVPSETRGFLIHLGKPESRLIVIASWETRMMSVLTRLDNLKRLLRQQLNEKKKQFMENLVVETLRRSQMNDQRVAAAYDVLVGGVAVASAARHRGVDEGHLRQAVNRVARKVRPLVEDQLKAWVEQEGVGETAAEIDALEAQKSAMFTLPPGQTKREWVASLR